MLVVWFASAYAARAAPTCPYLPLTCGEVLEKY